VLNPLRIRAGAEEFAAQAVASMLGLDGRELLRSILEGKRDRKGYLIVKEDVTQDEISRLRRSGLDVFTFERAYRREYPKGNLAAHTLGWVNKDGFGDAGLEMALEEELRGVSGRLRTLRDSRNRDYQAEVVGEEAPEAGSDIYLTIDETIQYAAENALLEAIRNTRVPSGTVVVVRPKTGDVLAMASYPLFDAKQKVKDEYDLLLRLNLTVAAPYEVGSVAKVVTAAAALETTNLRPESVISCGNGAITLFGRVIHDHHKYSALTMTDVLAKSSNVGAVNIGLAVGNSTMYNYLRKFGFAERTGLPLPSESAGSLRKPKDWEATSMGSIAMGHEYTSTPVQWAQAFSIIANNGALTPLRLVKARRRPGHAIEHLEPGKRDQRIRPETAITLRRMLEQVVLNGTGKAARLAGYTSGGKTGTAQMVDPKTGKYISRYNASFVGFAPVSDPEIVVAVTLNGSYQYGGEIAAPVFQKVATVALRTLGIRKDLPETAPAPEDPAVKAEPAMLRAENRTAEPPEEAAMAAPIDDGWTGPRMPDFRSMTKRRVLEKAAAEGWRVEAVGRGIAREQMPPAGAPLTGGRIVRIVFKP
jgi:cell division protein FtsI (penicillin-binding protein 3)